MLRNKILTVLFALMICLSLTGLGFSDEKKTYFTLGFHGSALWFPRDETVRDIYGSNFYPFGFYFRGELTENFALEVATDFIFESGRPLTLWGEPSPYGTASMTMIPIQISGIYVISLEKDFSPYIGGGFSKCTFKETLTMFGMSESASQSTVGFHLLFGVQKFWKNLGVKTEVRFLSASVEGIQGNVNIGGIGIYAGVMFRFGI